MGYGTYRYGVMRNGRYASSGYGSAFHPAKTVTLWWDTGIGLTTTGASNVSNWLDAKGSGIDLAQGTDAQRPEYGAVSKNDKKAISFDGVDEFLQGAFGSTYSQPNTVVIVVEGTDLSANEIVYDGDDNTNRNRVGERSSGFYFLFAGGIDDTSFTPAGWGIVSAVFNGASSSARKNGTDSSAIGNIGAASLDGFTVGADNNDSGHGNCDVLNIGILNGELSAALIAKGERWYNYRYGIF